MVYVSGIDTRSTVIVNKPSGPLISLNCVQIGITVNCQSIPIYGYKSKYFDTILRGYSIATGYLIINTSNNSDVNDDEYTKFKKSLSDIYQITLSLHPPLSPVKQFIVKTPIIESIDTGIAIDNANNLLDTYTFTGICVEYK